MDDPFFLHWLSLSPSFIHHKQQFGQVALDYYIYGKNPQLCISSGMHGDELGVIRSVSKAIQVHIKKLPSFIYIPIASPSAVMAKTRNNSRGQNVNRGFLKKKSVDESQAIMDCLCPYTFKLNVSFHQDLEYPTCFYLYDAFGKEMTKDITEQFAQFKTKLKEIKITLFNGIDDPKDPLLGFKFTDGYRQFPYNKSAKEDGQLETWMIINGISARSFTPEIPEQYPQDIKDTLVEEFFHHLVIPFF